jgi:hypothetical protein
MFRNQSWIGYAVSVLLLTIGVPIAEAQAVAGSLEQLRSLVRVGDKVTVTVFRRYPDQRPTGHLQEITHFHEEREGLTGVEDPAQGHLCVAAVLMDDLEDLAPTCHSRREGPCSARFAQVRESVAAW